MHITSVLIRISCKIASLIILVYPLTAAGPAALDYKISTLLQGKNQHPSCDYFWESYALTAPFFEAGAFLYTVQPSQLNDIQDMAITQAVTQSAVGITKYLVKRNRPERRYQPRLWNTRITPSFPSGHSASSAAFATLMALNYPETKLYMIAFSVLSGYSQLYVGNHYISDVIAGWILGYITGNIIYTLSPKTAGTTKRANNTQLSLKIVFPL